MAGRAGESGSCEINLSTHSTAMPSISDVCSLLPSSSSSSEKAKKSSSRCLYFCRMFMHPKGMESEKDDESFRNFPSQYKIVIFILEGEREERKMFSCSIEIFDFIFASLENKCNELMAVACISRMELASHLCVAGGFKLPLFRSKKKHRSGINLK